MHHAKIDKSSDGPKLSKWVQIWVENDKKYVQFDRNSITIVDCGIWMDELVSKLMIHVL